MDFEDVNSAFVNPSQSTTIDLSSANSSKKTFEKGPLSGWGQVVKVAKNPNYFGLGYHPTFRHPGERGRKKFNPVHFKNADYTYDLSVAVVDDASSSKPVVSGFIRKCPYGLFRKDVMHFVFLIPCPYPRHVDSL